MVGALIRRSVRAVLAVLALLLGLVVPVHAGPPAVAPPVTIQPAAPDVQPAPAIRIYLLTNRAHGPPVGVLVVFTEGDPHRAGAILYAYCGGDPINRSDPSGLDWEWANGSGWQYVEGTPKETPKPTWTPGELPILYVDAAIYREIHQRTTRYGFQSGPFEPSPLTITRGMFTLPAGGPWAHLMGQNPSGAHAAQAEQWAMGYIDRERQRAMNDAWASNDRSMAAAHCSMEEQQR